MEKTVKIILFDSLAGRDFAYGKGENEVPEHLAAEWVAKGLGEYVGAKPSPLEGGKGGEKPHELAERAISPQAKKAEKRG